VRQRIFGALAKFESKEAKSESNYKMSLIGLPENLLAAGEAREHRTLLEVSRAIASHTNLSDLFRALIEGLRPPECPRCIVDFDFLAVALYDADRNVMRTHFLDSGAVSPVKSGLEFSMEESIAGLVWQTQQALIIADTERETRFSAVIDLIRAHRVRSSCLVPLTTARRRLGALHFGANRPMAYSEADLGLLHLLARQVAVAVENTLNYESILALQAQLSHERDRLKLLLDLNNAVVSNLDLNQLFRAIPTSVRRAMQCDAACLSLPDKEKAELRSHGLDFPGGRGFLVDGMVLPIADTSPGRAFETGEPFCWGSPPTDLAPIALEMNAGEGFQSGCFLPIISGDRKMGVLHLLDRRENAFSAQDVEFLVQVTAQVAIALENALEYRNVNESRQQLAEERLYLLDEIRSEHRFQEVVGSSPALKKVLTQVEIVAPTSSTVLINGETGTGKEMIARAIHKLSPRRDHTFVKLNCAAIPLGLLESELFGHEKGAFTGAIDRRVGRFELANGGTLFLDEIGDIPLELQSKLLRVLQEQEFERLGSTRSIKVDVRIVAATNHDLGKMVEARQFRADLYYRLNVFPLQLPALRERRTDIPELVRYFAGKYAQKMNRAIDAISVEAMDALVRYDWPGNIRELQNLIERAVILSKGSVLQPPIAELQSPADKTACREWKPNSLADAQREHIVQALRETKWVLGGLRGAAKRLGIPRTTLLYAMRRLGIVRQRD
jgi:formate hydrogenlyase transcriptional activator